MKATPPLQPVKSDTPGVRPSCVFRTLSDNEAKRLLPSDAFPLIHAMAPERLRGSERYSTLGRALSLELAVDDPARRRVLLASIPKEKLQELKTRIPDYGSIDLDDDLTPSARRALLAFFGFATGVHTPSTASEPVHLVDARRSLFPHQKRAAIAAEHLMYNEDGRAMLHLPTGVGKTRTAMSIVASHLRGRAHGLVLWLAATGELLEQAADEFSATWGAVGDRTLACTRFWGGYNPEISRVRDGILIAGLAKLHAIARSRQRIWDLGDTVTLVVFDEAHQAVAPTYKDLLETIVTRKPRLPLLGLSATPGRTWNDPDRDRLVSELFFGNKVTIDFDGENPIHRLTQDGYLASAEFKILNVQPSLRLTRPDEIALNRHRDVPGALSERLGRDQHRNLSLFGL